MIIPLRDNDFDVLISSGVLDDTRSYGEYTGYRNLRGSLRLLINKLGDCEKYKEESRKIMLPVTDAIKQVKEALDLKCLLA